MKIQKIDVFKFIGLEAEPGEVEPVQQEVRGFIHSLDGSVIRFVRSHVF